MEDPPLRIINGQIVEADRLLARAAVDEAPVGTDVANAEKEFDEAQDARADSRFDKAVRFFGKARAIATQEIDHDDDDEDGDVDD